MDELIETIKRWIEKYFAILPFERKGVYAKMMTEPDKTMASEAKKTGFMIGLKDVLVGITPILAFALIILVFASVAIVAILAYVGQVDALAPYVAPALGITGACFIAYILFVVIGWIFNTLIVHLIAKLLGGKGSFGKMLGILGTLGATNGLFAIPMIFISIIPIIGQVAMLVSIYSIYLEYRAIRAVHGIDRNKAIVTVAIPIIIGLMIFMAFYVMYALMIVAAGFASD